MSELLYRPDADHVRERLRTWWDGGDIGRPMMQITAPREEPLEEVEPVPEPEGWQTDYSTSNFGYRVYLSKVACSGTYFLGDSMPAVAPDLAPNCLALFLGCRGAEREGTVWCEPFIEDPDEARFEYDPENFYWNFCLRLTREQLRLGEGKFLLQFPDLIEGLDTLAAARGTDRLLIDLVDRPEWVRCCLRSITDRYFHYYDILYDLMRDEIGGSIYWAWAPGRMVKLQCDVSAMISPGMFGDFMVPVLREMTERISYSMYHWDGPGALQHHEHLLSVENLDMLQWTPGVGAEPTWHRKWWPYYHRTFEAGKKVLAGVDSIERLKELKAEFGENFKKFLLCMNVKSPQQAELSLKVASD
jgi:5-methyltetrahydrofolate--homocysteine methyltransferase